jgi:hypothetical protein
MAKTLLTIFPFYRRSKGGTWYRSLNSVFWSRDRPGHKYYVKERYGDRIRLFY